MSGVPKNFTHQASEKGCPPRIGLVKALMALTPGVGTRNQGGVDDRFLALLSQGHKENARKAEQHGQRVSHDGVAVEVHVKRSEGRGATVQSKNLLGGVLV